MIKKRAGRPAGKVERKRIKLPDGDVLVSLYSTFSKDTGLTAKRLHHMKRRQLLPTVMVAGVLYIRDRSGREAIAKPVAKQGARR